MTETVRSTYGVDAPKPYVGFKLTEACVNPDLLVGIEIEVEAVRHGVDEMTKWCKPLGIGIKQDGSLRIVNGLHAWEYITKPTPIGQVLPILREFYRLMGFNEDNFSDRTSIHVHANCTDLKWPTIANIALTYTVLEEILFEFVNNRPGNKDDYSRDTNLYCVPWNQCRDHYGVVAGFLHDPSVVLGRWQKYTALNLNPLHRQGTIEFRHMHGTADMDKLKKWLDIIGAIFKYAEGITHEALVAEILKANTISHYEQFFRAVTGEQLPYNHTYQKKLEEGIIFAKYSLMSARKKTKDNHPVNPVPQAAPQGAPGEFRFVADFEAARNQILGEAAMNRAFEDIRLVQAARQAPPAPERAPAMRAGRAIRAFEATRAGGIVRPIPFPDGGPEVIMDDLEDHREEGEF